MGPGSGPVRKRGFSSNAQKIGSAQQDMRVLWPSFQLPAKVASLLGAGSVLLGTLPADSASDRGRNGLMNAARQGKRLAIVGAGPAGLAASWRLREHAAFEVTLFEKSNGVFGRAATRTRHGLRLDPGANYLRTDLPDVAEMVHRELRNDDLVEIFGDIDVFDRCGTVTAGEPALNEEKRWTYRQGINTLGKLLAAAADCKIIFGTRVGGVIHDAQSRSWKVIDENDNCMGRFDLVLVALPAPQAMALFDDAHREVRDALASASYQSQWSFTFGFDAQSHAWPGERYALVNADRQHDLAWLSNENAKPGRVPEGILVLMAQMSPAWTRRFFDRDAGELAPGVSRIIAKLLDWADADFRWFDCQRWRYALPTGHADYPKLRAFEASGLFVAGDAIVGKGRVPQALQSGLDTAVRILELA